MEEFFKVQYLSNEKDFIFNFGINKGYVISYSKVDRCFLISAQARQLYRNICNYAYGDKKDCFPSQKTLMLELGWSKNTLISYIKELEEAGFIILQHNPGKVTTYNIVELHKVPVLTHSEILHEVKDRIADIDKFYTLFEKYLQSDLYNNVKTSKNPLIYYEEIIKWFLQEEVVISPVSPSKPSNLPKAFPKNEGITIEKTLDKKPKKKHIKYTEIPVDEWNSKHFCDYFCDKYVEKFNLPYLISIKELSIIKKLIEAKPKKLIQQYIDWFFDIDVFKPKDVTVFASKYVQTSLDYYQKYGKLPTYTENKQEVNSEWLKNLDDRFK